MKSIKKYSDVFLVLSFPMWSYSWFCFSKSEKFRLRCIYQNMSLPFSCLLQTSFSYPNTLGWDRLLPYPINLPLPSSASLHILPCHHPSLLLPPDLCLTQPPHFLAQPPNLSHSHSLPFQCAPGPSDFPWLYPCIPFSNFLTLSSFVPHLNVFILTNSTYFQRDKKPLSYCCKYEVTALDVILMIFNFSLASQDSY